jgi:single-stranded DNA-binding protein
MTMSKNKDTGEQKTEFIDCPAWEKLAEIVENT